MTAPSITPVDRPAQIATVMDRASMSGAQAVLTMAIMHLTRHTTAFQITGSSWDRQMAVNALRDCDEALAEIRALVAGPEAA